MLGAAQTRRGNVERIRRRNAYINCAIRFILLLLEGEGGGCTLIKSRPLRVSRIYCKTLLSTPFPSFPALWNSLRFWIDPKHRCAIGWFVTHPLYLSTELIYEIKNQRNEAGLNRNTTYVEAHYALIKYWFVTDTHCASVRGLQGFRLHFIICISP